MAREIPMMLVASAAVLVLGLRVEVYDRTDGIILLLFFSIFLYYTVMEVLRGRRSDPLLQESKAAVPTREWSTLTHALLAISGLGGLIAGAEATVTGAVSLAEILGVPRAVVALSVVAVGTSLPELVTSLVAARRGQVDLAVGNVVGSNIFNLLFVLAVTSVLRPVAIPAAGVSDLLVMAGMSAVLLLFGVTHGRRIVRGEGALLLAAYLGYLVLRVGG